MWISTRGCFLSFLLFFLTFFLSLAHEKTEATESREHVTKRDEMWQNRVMEPANKISRNTRAQKGK